jgi:hypothetical protein
VTLNYDANGNLLSNGEKCSYAFNARNQLVVIQNYSSSGGGPTYDGDILVKFTCSAFGQRVSEQPDSGGLESVNGYRRRGGTNLSLVPLPAALGG